MNPDTSQKRQPLSQEEIEQTFRDLGLDDPEVRRYFQNLSKLGDCLGGWKSREYYDYFTHIRKNFKNPGGG